MFDSTNLITNFCNFLDFSFSTFTTTKKILFVYCNNCSKEISPNSDILINKQSKSFIFSMPDQQKPPTQ